jgi:hypothetical protein
MTERYTKYQAAQWFGKFDRFRAKHDPDTHPGAKAGQVHRCEPVLL